MKITLFAQQLVVGGAPLNGIELAVALRDLHGHDVTVFATPGPLASLLEEKNIRYVPAPEVHRHPSWRKMRALRQHVRRERPDVVHAWEWSQCLDAYFGVHVPMGVPVAVTDMLMHVNRVLPKSLLTTFGTPEIVELAQTAGRKRVELLVPPVDVHLNAAGSVDAYEFRDRFGIRADELLIVTVSRLDPAMKQDSLMRTISVAGKLARNLPIRFLLVGDGGARPVIEAAAAECNSRLGRECITLAGELLDPRIAYAAADIVVGMGSSALRAMAFEKPVVVVGSKGFAEPFNARTAERFYYTGMYGEGDGAESNAALESALIDLCECSDRRRSEGQFAREFVVRLFSLEVVSSQLSALLEKAVSYAKGGVSVAAVGRTLAVYCRDRAFLWRSVAPEQNRDWSPRKPQL